LPRSSVEGFGPDAALVGPEFGVALEAGRGGDGDDERVEAGDAEVIEPAF